MPYQAYCTNMFMLSKHTHFIETVAYSHVSTYTLFLGRVHIKHSVETTLKGCNMPPPSKYNGVAVFFEIGWLTFSILVLF